MVPLPLKVARREVLHRRRPSEKSAGLCAREPEEMIEAAENDKEKNKKEEEEEDVDFRAIAARNQYLEEQTKTLENLNAILKKGEGLEEKEMKKLVKQDKSGRWDYTSATGTIPLGAPSLLGLGITVCWQLPLGLRKRR